MRPPLRKAVFYGGLLLVWEGVTHSGMVAATVLPPPEAVARAMGGGLRTGTLWAPTMESLRRLVLGFGVAIPIGVLVGFVVSRLRALDDTVGSLLMSLQSLPNVAWLPVALVWTGGEEGAILFVTALGAFLAIALSTASGVKNVPLQYLRAAHTLGARPPWVELEVVLPAALPAILEGMKQGWAFAWRALISGEMIFKVLGLGRLLQQGRTAGDLPLVLAVMLIIVLIGLTVDRVVFGRLERRVRRTWGLEVA